MDVQEVLFIINCYIVCHYKFGTPNIKEWFRSFPFIDLLIDWLIHSSVILEIKLKEGVGGVNLEFWNMTLQFYFTLRQQFSLLITAKVHDNITNIFAVILDSYVYCCELHNGQQGDVWLAVWKSSKLLQVLQTYAKHLHKKDRLWSWLNVKSFGCLKSSWIAWNESSCHFLHCLASGWYFTLF